METVELRCDSNPHRLFAKLLNSGEVVVSENLLEFKCRDCAKQVPGSMVFHRFNIAGELIETLVVGP